MINKVILIGNLGGDPELRTASNGNPFANFSLATTEKWRDQQGNQQEATEWHKIVAWGKLAEICGQYLSKGSRVYIEGKLKTRQYEKDGSTRYVTEIVAHEMKMLGDRNSGGQRMTPAQEAAEEQRWRREQDAMRQAQQQTLVPPQDDRNRHQPPGYDDVPF